MPLNTSNTASEQGSDTGNGYSRENAERFAWSSVSGDLNPERMSHLATYLVGKTVLDAGCGGGAFVDFLSREGMTVTGIDLHATFLEIAQERGYQGSFVQGDVTALPFADKQFDCTFCFDVLEHVDDYAAIRELARVTRTRLILAVPRQETEFMPYNLTFRHYQDNTHLRYYSEDTLERLAQSVTPKAVHVLSELNVSMGEMVRAFTGISEDALHSRIENVLTPIVSKIRAAAEDSHFRDSVAGSREVASSTGHGVKGYLRARATADPIVQQNLQKAFGSAYAALTQQSVNEAVNALTGQIAESILFEASFPTIPTGLVAVIDL